MTETPIGRPQPLTLAMLLGALFGVAGTALGLWGLHQLTFGDPAVLVVDDPAAAAVLRGAAIPLLALYVSACLTAGAASWALWRHDPRSRLFLVALLAEFVIGDTAVLAVAMRTVQITAFELALTAVGFTVLVAFALWYLFRNAAVVSYYEAVHRKTNGTDPGAPPAAPAGQ